MIHRRTSLRSTAAGTTLAALGPASADDVRHAAADRAAPENRIGLSAPARTSDELSIARRAMGMAEFDTFVRAEVGECVPVPKAAGIKAD